MGIIWLFVTHIPRGVVGFVILRRQPKSHDVVDNIDLSDLSKDEVTIENVMEKVKLSLSAVMVQSGEKMRKLLIGYFILSMVCNLLDLITFIVAYRWFSVEGHEHTDILLILASLLYLVIDCYYCFWII